MTLRKPFLYAFSIALGLVAASGALAWTGPSVGAPGGNASAPLNVSSTGQTKAGGLRVNSGGAATGLEVVSGTTILNNGILGTFGILPSYATWNAYGVGSGGAAIYNDGTIYKTLMIVGNSSNGGVRTVGIWDNLNVSGAITSSGVAVCLANGTNCPASSNSTRTNWGTNGAIANVVGQLAWKNYGNGHTIFDASNGTSPDGTAVNNTNAQIAWVATYPTLMGWNGGNTFGVRVDSARIADSASAVPWASITGMPAFGANQVNGRVRMYEVGCASGWASSCDTNTNGQVDIADVANSAQSVSFNGGLTTASAPTFAGLTFSSTNPTIASAGSYIIIPNGVYVSGGTLYSQAVIQARGGIYNDTAANLTIGGGTSGNTVFSGAVTATAFYYSSDARLKKNIETISHDKALQDILALNPVTYNWKDASRGSGNQLGFIAQQVEAIVPELVTTDASTTLKAVDYARVAPLLVGAIQAQQARLDAQQKQIDTLKAEIGALKSGK